MTLFNVALRNIKKNFYDYSLYFASMIFSIMIYYTFTSIQYNEEVAKLAENSMKISAPIQASSFVIAIFSAMFIWYSNSFFTKKRKKEIGLYSLLGVKKKQIGRMLFYENLAMGFISLVAGILIGSLLSKLFIMLLVKLMGFDVAIKFAIIPKAIINTAIVFLIIFLVTSIHGYSIIYRFKLIELFRAEKSGERQPKSSIISAIISVVLIGSGYYIYLMNIKLTNNFLLIIFATLILTVAGTYFLFSSLMVFLVKLSIRNKKKYYKGVNMIGTSHLLYRIKSHSRTLATIAVLSASTLTAVSVIFSMYYDISVKMDRNMPFTYAYYSKDKSIDKKAESIIAKYPKNKILASAESEILEAKGKYPYVSKFVSSGDNILLISESDYNEVAEVRKIEKLNLKSSKEAFIVDEHYRKAFMDSYKGKTASLLVNNKNMDLKIVDFESDPLFNSYMMGTLIVVKDEVFNVARDNGDIYRLKSYITDNKKDSEELTNEMIKVVKTELKSKKEIGPRGSIFSDYYSKYIDAVRGNGLSIFIGAFLGLVFLTATGSIIFFKQLSEANDDRIRYRILRNIGVTRREIKLIVSKQMLFIFLTPLLVGAVHSIVAISLLQLLLGSSLIVPVAGTIGIYTIIYFVYYLTTVNSYSKIVSA